jgi:hypothetical protein
MKPYVCEQCGEEFDEPQPFGHTRAEHSPRCDGDKGVCAPDCPVPVLCGPVSESRTP